MLTVEEVVLALTNAETGAFTLDYLVLTCNQFQRSIQHFVSLEQRF